MLFNQSEFESHIRMVPCFADSDVPCINAFAARVGDGTVVTIHGGYTDEELHGYVWLDGEETGLGSPVSLGLGFTLRRARYDHYRLEQTGSVFVDIFVRGRYLDIRVQSKEVVCGDAGGLLSSCDQDSTDDFKLPDGRIICSDGSVQVSCIYKRDTDSGHGGITQEEIHEAFGQAWEVPPFEISLFIYNHGPYHERRHIKGSKAGYSLYFDDSVAKSDAINTFTGPDFTIEFELKDRKSVV